MAKSVRASVSKRNRANLRKKVFGPVVDARTERLAAKLQELASQPRPKVEKSESEMETDATGMQGVYRKQFPCQYSTDARFQSTKVPVRRPPQPTQVGPVLEPPTPTQCDTVINVLCSRLNRNGCRPKVLEKPLSKVRAGSETQEAPQLDCL